MTEDQKYHLQSSFEMILNYCEINKLKAFEMYAAYGLALVESPELRDGFTEHLAPSYEHAKNMKKLSEMLKGLMEP
jgi:hypothetical protein